MHHQRAASSPSHSRELGRGSAMPGQAPPSLAGVALTARQPSSHCRLAMCCALLCLLFKMTGCTCAPVIVAVSSECGHKCGCTGRAPACDGSKSWSSRYKCTRACMHACHALVSACDDDHGHGGGHRASAPPHMSPAADGPHTPAAPTSSHHHTHTARAAEAHLSAPSRTRPRT